MTCTHCHAETKTGCYYGRCPIKKMQNQARKNTMTAAETITDQFNVYHLLETDLLKDYAVEPELLTELHELFTTFKQNLNNLLAEIPE